MQSMYKLWTLINVFLVWSTMAYWQGKTDQNTDKCFCQLTGQVDDCCCSIEDVEKLNKIYIYPRLENLARRNYFRYVRLKLFRECPFWSDESQCALKDCSVDKCSVEELPSGLKNIINGHPKNEKKKKTENVDDGPCSVGDEETLGTIDTTISESQKESLKDWSNYDSDASFCVDLEEDSEKAHWIDLLLNPEQYTGYQGQGANRIWSSIYKENCFLPSKKMRTYDEFKKAFLTKTCLEKRVFYRTVSGLHASINIHLSFKWLHGDGALSKKKIWGPNLDEFQKRFDPDYTGGNGPYWLKNLYFTYLLVLRAVTKSQPYWKETIFYTGDEEEDKTTHKIVIELVNSSKTCPSTFDETQMFTGDPEKAHALKEEFRERFKNITRIMDCVGCEKCRLWGKLQTAGIATALKILFSSDKWDEIPVVNGKKFSLSRTEVVALFNALNKLSSSLHYLDEFKKINEKRKLEL